MAIKVCRLCLQTIQGKYFDVNTVEPSTGFMPYRDQITTCIPEMAVDLIPDSLICASCVVSLKAAYDFKTKCLQVEERIRSHFENKPLDSEYDLSELVIDPIIVKQEKTEEVDLGIFEGEEPELCIVKKESEALECDPLSTDTLLKRVLERPILCLHDKAHLTNSSNGQNHGSSEYICNFCNQTFLSLQVLRRHNSSCNKARGKPSQQILTRRPHLPLKAKNHLTQWLFNHSDHPYPTEYEKQTLMKETNLTLLQVENWFINARRRILQDFNNRRKKYSRTKVATKSEPQVVDSVSLTYTG